MTRLVSVRPKIDARMISERCQIAERFLSEGNDEEARIRDNRIRELNKIQSETYQSIISTLVLSTDGNMFKFLKCMTPDAKSATGVQ